MWKGRTKREKRLLYLLLIILIVTVGYYCFLRPIYVEFQQAKLEYKTVLLEIKMTRESMKSISKLKKVFEDENDFYMTHKNEYLKLESDILAEQYILSNLFEHKIEPKATQIGHITPKEGETKINTISIKITAHGELENFMKVIDEFANDERVSTSTFNVNKLEESDSMFEIHMELNYYMLDEYFASKTS